MSAPEIQRLVSDKLLVRRGNLHLFKLDRVLDRPLLPHHPHTLDDRLPDLDRRRLGPVRHIGDA
jgi:hypothetical protein